MWVDGGGGLGQGWWDQGVVARGDQVGGLRCWTGAGAGGMGPFLSSTGGCALGAGLGYAGGGGGERPLGVPEVVPERGVGTGEAVLVHGEVPDGHGPGPLSGRLEGLLAERRIAAHLRRTVGRRDGRSRRGSVEAQSVVAGFGGVTDSAHRCSAGRRPRLPGGGGSPFPSGCPGSP